MIKNFIQKIANFFNYKVIKISSRDRINLIYENYNIDDITKFIIKKSQPVIFDIGANKGQSIERYKKIFQKSTIHSFEPNIDEINILKEKYQNEKNLFLNNLAVGEKEGNLEFNINARSGHSSFKELIPNTTWLKKRSFRENVDSENYTSKKVNSKIITLDDYVKKNNIENIDILKIDTQGYEDKVLQGAQNLIKENRIKLIQVEIIFSEIYENPLQIYDIEKILIPNDYKLFAISNGGSLISKYSYESDFIYIAADTYKDFKANSPYLNN
jgi:FkbM family methyltransferase